jgi:hypothetical protein
LYRFSAGTLPNPGENPAGENFPAKLLSPALAECRSFRVQMMFPSNSCFAEVEPIFPFHPEHPARYSMVNLRLQFADKAVEGSHLENRHEAQLLQNPALPGNDIESMVESVETSVRAGLPFKMMSSHCSSNQEWWLGLRSW